MGLRVVGARGFPAHDRSEGPLKGPLKGPLEGGKLKKKSGILDF